MKFMLFLSAALLFALFAKAQNTFTLQDTVSCKAQVPAMRSFLQNKGITNPEHFKYLDIGIIQNKNGKLRVVLYLETVDADTWLNLRYNYQEQFNRSLEKDIFDKLVFLCEVDAADALISVYSQDRYQLLAGLESEKNYVFDIKENKSRAEVTRKLTLPAYALASSKTLTGRKLLENLNQKIIRILQTHYKGKSFLWHDAQFTVVSQYPDDLRVKITNIKQEVLKENWYFELIYITINFKERTETQLNFDCKVDAKYGTSILLAPRSSDYKDISQDSKYQRHIDEYASEVRDLLDKELNK